MFILCVSVILGIYAVIDSYRSYKKGIFKEYRKMAPFVIHYRKDRSFLPHVIGNALLGIGMIGFGIWFWFFTH